MGTALYEVVPCIHIRRGIMLELEQYKYDLTNIEAVLSEIEVSL